MILPSSAACQFVSKMLFSDLSEESLEVKDGVGEILNIIIGEMKTILDATIYKFEISIPSTVKIDNYKLKQSDSTESIAQTFKIDESPFQVIFDYKLILDEEKKEEPKTEEKPQLSAFEKLSMLVDKAQKDQPNKE